MLTVKLVFSYFRLRKMRAVLTTLSVTAAVAALIAVQGLNGSVDYVTGQMAGLLGGRAQLEVKGPQPGMSDSLLPTVKETAGVQTAVPFVQIAAQVQGLPGFTTIMGIVPEEDEKIRTYQIVQGRMPASGQREIAVPQELLRGKLRQLGDSLYIQTMQGMLDFKLVGILENSGVARANAGTIVFMPMDVAQKAFGMEHKISSLSVVIRNPNNLTEVQKALQKRVDDDVEVDTPLGRNRNTDQLLGLIKSLNNAYGLTGLFLVFFVVHNSMGVAVSEQRNQIAILRALGWRQRETRRLIIIQALLIGVVGSSIGLLLGTYVAHSLLNTVSEFFREIGKITIPRVRFSGTEYVLTWVMGVLSCLISAWLPARKAAGIAPAEVMNGQYLKGERGYAWWWIVVGALVLSGSSMAIFSGKSLSYLPAALIGILTGAAVLMPPVLIFFLKSLEPLVSRFFGLTGRLGLGSFRLTPRRTAITGMPILLGLAVAFGFLGISQSFEQTLTNWVKQQVSSDLIISQGFRTGDGNEVPLPEELLERVRKVEGVKAAAATHAAGFKWNGRPVDLALYDVGEWREFTSPPVLEPGKEQAMDALQTGGQIWISQSLALKYGLHRGEKLAIPTPSGTVEFPIAAIIKDFFSYNGTVHMNRQDYIKYWGDHSIDYVYISVEPGVAPSKVRERLEENLNADYRVTVALTADFRDGIIETVNSISRIFNLVVIVALLVAATGTINSLLIAVLEGTREIGTLRSLGLKSGQIGSLFMIEAGSLLIAGILLSIPVALSIQASGILFYINSIGWVLDLAVPWVKNFGVTVAMTLAVLLSAFYPAWLASRVDPVKALRSE